MAPICSAPGSTVGSGPESHGEVIEVEGRRPPSPSGSSMVASCSIQLPECVDVPG